MLERAKDPASFKKGLKRRGPLRLKGLCYHNARSAAPLLQVYGDTVRVGVATYPLEHHTQPVEAYCQVCKTTWVLDLAAIRALLRNDHHPERPGVRTPRMEEIAQRVISGANNQDQ